ncbi:MAG TPA: phosphohistidine phosphatase SixA [Sumerlaeia bacterium]|nr:phosphohistidine phosphatase SixA [Sumerlaeia bacterium]
MRLYLAQHGEAHSEEVDPERRLTDRGVEDVERMAKFLKPLGLRVDAIWHSGKARAAQTADILASALVSTQGVVQRDGLAPKDPTGPLKEALLAAGAADGAREDVMIVGHLPFLGLLASSLIANDALADAVAFRQGGVACIDCADDGTARLAWMVIPDLIP